jgi:hypothetical protein
MTDGPVDQADDRGLIEADEVQPMAMESGVVREPARVPALREAVPPDGGGGRMD